jgi:hypothetical protein
MDGWVADVLYVTEQVLEFRRAGDAIEERSVHKERIACDGRTALQGYMPPMCNKLTDGRLGCQGKEGRMLPETWLGLHALLSVTCLHQLCPYSF